MTKAHHMGKGTHKDDVNHPVHYTGHASGVECIQITRHMNFNLGNVFKYIWRAGSKGKQLQDLEKAKWYLDDEIRRVKADQDKPVEPIGDFRYPPSVARKAFLEGYEE